MKRTFITGSEWLYYKIYSGPKTADRILSDAIRPISEKLLEDDVIDSWFFIRYADPKLHLRIRFHLISPYQIEKIIPLVHDVLLPFVETNLVWKVANDTYNRELERYGYTLIEKAEQLFFFESKMIVGILSMIEGDEGEIIRWLIGIRAIDETLDTFGYTEENKLSFLGLLRDGFGEEFGMNKDLKLQLSEKYRNEKKTIEQVLLPSNDEGSEMSPLFELLKIKRKQTLNIATELRDLEKKNHLEIPVDQLMNSYLHMMVNRLFKSNQRLHELVLYDFLCQYYASQIARKKQMKNKLVVIQ
jgi:thiopeptide-type bacteriocin biosynthesis protein